MVQDYEIGQIVFSKSGRDKGKLFIVMHVEEDYLYLADGKLRKVETPKKKKIKHVQKTNHVLVDIKEKIQEDCKISNSELRKAIENYLDTSSL